MKVADCFSDLQQILSPWRQNHTIGFVPTMGNLHDGHLSLVNHAKSLADKTVVSIFVNPLQFGPNEDFDAYPRTTQKDIELLEALKVDCVFLPTRKEIFPDGKDKHTIVSVPALDGMHCGASRPGFFNGICTVVSKYFHMVQPTVAVFCEKDYQQLFAIKRMVSDLCFSVKVVGCPTVRESDGLAMSSRNQYLSGKDREIAPRLYETLKWLRDQILLHRQFTEGLKHKTIKSLEDFGFEVDYVNICDSNTLLPVTEHTREFIILSAAFLGRTRLIDNIKESFE